MKKKLLSLFIVLAASFIAKNNINQFDSHNTSKNSSNFTLTRHAECRMECRGIDRDEIAQILQINKINKRKSNPNARPMPTYAYEGRSRRDKQLIRVVAAQDEQKTKIITVIDLENKYNCHCD